MVVRKRQVPYSGPRPWTTWYNPNWATDPSLGASASGVLEPIQYVETTDSRGHSWPLAGRPIRDSGGGFTTIKVTDYFTDSPATVRSVRGAGRTYEGQQWASSPVGMMNSAIAAVTPSSDASLNVLGTKAIANTIPTNPIADAGTFIGELKAGLPRLVGKELFKTKLKDYRKVGSEYLNVEFGWKPLVSDLLKFGQATIESDKILKQLHRDSGRNIHRKFAFPDEVTESTQRINNRQAYVNGLAIDPRCFVSTTGGPLELVTKMTTKTWFSGCFTYHVNLGNTLPDRISRAAAEARKLYGVELTPATVWNLAPWSWAVDWEGNIGDVLHNVSRFSQDGLVLRYGYIMQEKTCKIDATLHRNGSIKTSANALGRTLIVSVTAKSKVRRAATPFGFGFDMKALTGRQSAILGALAISRSPNRL